MHQGKLAKSDRKTWKSQGQKDFWRSSNPPAADLIGRRLWSYLKQQHIWVVVMCICICTLTTLWLTKQSAEHSTKYGVRQRGKQSRELPDSPQQKHDACSILHHAPTANLHTNINTHHMTQCQESPVRGLLFSFQSSSLLVSCADVLLLHV